MRNFQVGRSCHLEFPQGLGQWVQILTVYINVLARGSNTIYPGLFDMELGDNFMCLEVTERIQGDSMVK